MDDIKRFVTACSLACCFGCGIFPTPAIAATSVDRSEATTLIVNASVPLWLLLPAQKALFAYAEHLAEQYHLYFRVNSKIPDAVDRVPSCVPGTATMLHANMSLLKSLSNSDDSLEVSIYAADCLGGHSVYIYSLRPMPKGDNDVPLLQTVASEAFQKLEDRLNNDPAAAAGLGWNQDAK